MAGYNLADFDALVEPTAEPKEFDLSEFDALVEDTSTPMPEAPKQPGLFQRLNQAISPDADTFMGRWAGNLGGFGQSVGQAGVQIAKEIPETIGNIGEGAAILGDFAMGPDQGPMTPKADRQADLQAQGQRANEFLGDLGQSMTGHGALALSTGAETGTARSMAAMARLVDNDAANEWLTGDIIKTEKFLADATQKNKTKEVLGEKGSQIFEGALSSLGSNLPAMVFGQAAVLSQVATNTFEEELSKGAETLDAAQHAVVETGITFWMGRMAGRAGARTMEEQLSPAMRAAGKLIAETPSLKAMAVGIGGEAFEEGLINGIRQHLDINDPKKTDKTTFDFDEFFTAAATGAAAAGAAKIPSLASGGPGEAAPTSPAEAAAIDVAKLDEDLGKAQTPYVADENLQALGITGKEFYNPLASQLDMPDPNDLVFQEELQGTTGPLLMSDPSGGKWVQKMGAGGQSMHAINEAMADQIYNIMGAAVPESTIATKTKGGANQIVKLSKFIEGAKTLMQVRHSDVPYEYAQVKKKLQEHFVLDALLDNRDVVGAGSENPMANILVKDGVPYRVDNGGALGFKGMGGFKKLTPEVNEIVTFRDPKINPTAAEVFAGVTDADIAKQVADIVAHKTAIIEATPTDQKEIIGQRIDWLASKFPAKTTTVTKEGGKTTTTTTTPNSKTTITVGESFGEALNKIPQRVIKNLIDGALSAHAAVKSAFGLKNESGPVNSKVASFIRGADQSSLAAAVAAKTDAEFVAATGIRGASKSFKSALQNGISAELQAKYPAGVPAVEGQYFNADGTMKQLSESDKILLKTYSPTIGQAIGKEFLSRPDVPIWVEKWISPSEFTSYVTGYRGFHDTLPPNFTFTDYLAVQRYIGAGYSDVNMMKRDGILGEDKFWSAYSASLSKALAKMPQAQDATVIRRAKHVRKEIMEVAGKPGAVFSDLGFMSAAKHPSSIPWAKDYDSIDIVVMGPTKGRDISDINSSEAEVIFPPNTSFEVVEIKYTDNGEWLKQYPTIYVKETTKKPQFDLSRLDSPEVKAAAPVSSSMPNWLVRVLGMDEGTAKFKDAVLPSALNSKVTGETKSSRLRQWFNRYFTTGAQSNLYARLRNATDERIARVHAEIFEAQVRVKAASEAVHKAFGENPSQAQWGLVRDFLQGKSVNIPAELKTTLARNRAHIDNLARNLLAEGVVDPDSDLGMTIIENEGIWLNRTYKKHTKANWMETIINDAQVVSDAKAYLQEQYPEDTDAQIEEKITSLIDKDSAAAWATPTSGKAATGFKGILKPRQDIAEPLRKLMGEELDPLINYMNSVSKIAELQSHAQWINDVKALGQTAGFLSKPGDGIPQGYRTIDSLRQPALAELSGYKASPEMIRALESVTKPEFITGTWGLFCKLASIPRRFIKFNPQTVFRNTYGTPLFALSAGDLFSSDFRSSMKSVKNMLQRSGENSAYIKRRIELGVLRPSSDVEYISRLSGEWGNASTSDPLALQGQWLKNLDKVAGEIYSGPDNVVRLAAFDSKVRKLAKAYPGESLDTIEKMAAKDVADHYPDFTRHPAFVRAIGASPLIGDFVGFMYDGLRISVNTMKSIYKETTDSNPAVRDIGYSRLIGFAAATAFTPLLSEVSQLFSGISDEEEDLLAELDPSWDEFTPWLYLGRHEDGSPRRFNLSYIDPFGPIRKAMIAAFSAGEPVEAIEEIADGWVREGIMTERFASVARNQTRTGAPVYNPEDTTWEKSKAIAGYMAVPVTPGVVNAVKNIEAGLKGEVGKNDQTRDIGTELAGVFGFKESPFSVSKAMEYRSYYYDSAFSNIQNIAFKEVSGAEAVTPGRIIDNYERAYTQYKAFVAEAHRDYTAAVTLGADEAVVYDLIKQATSVDVADQIVSNSPLPFYPSEGKITTIEGRQDGETRYKLLFDTIEELEQQQASE
jgi:hypothetical protein